MSYHPIFGITIFLISVLIAYLLGKKSFFKKNNNNKYQAKNKKLMQDSITPDASWLE